MTDEGYTKFVVEWQDRAPIDDPAVAELERWRRPLFEAGLVGHYPETGIGYGNLSLREAGTRRFVISGTRTGHLPRTGREHYARVIDYDIDANRVTCSGATQASSETLTHAAIYELDPRIRAVVHIHEHALWERLKAQNPATAEDAAYGTPEMAREFARLWHDGGLDRRRLAAMAGHEGGIVSIGETLREAAGRLLALQEPGSAAGERRDGLRENAL